jgi:plasmid stability protein
MPQLIVRQIEAKLVRRLKQQAGAQGVSMEEEHRRILRTSLLGTPRARESFKEALRRMPNAGKDSDFKRDRQTESLA